MIALALFVEDVRQVRETRLQAHNMPFAQTVDRWIGDLAEILAKELRDVTRLVGDDRERRVVAHRSDRFLGVLDHGAEDQFHILHRQPGGDLTAEQFLTIPRGQARLAALGQVGHRAETLDARGIVGGVGDLVLDREIFIKRAVVEIDRNHLAGAKAALLAHARFGQQHHPAFGPDDEEIVGGQRVAQRAERIAIHARNRPAAVGHRERGGPVPRLHDAGEVRVHRAVVVGDVAFGGPRLGHEDQLRGRRVAPGAAQRLEHRVERGGVRCARGDNRLDVFRMLAEREARHLDLVALHPVLVAADRVDLAIVGEAAERLCQPPLREGVGRITLVENRDAAFEQLVREVGEEVGKALGKEQPLVDDRARRQAADVKVGDLCRDHLFLDPAADEIKLLFELSDRLLVGQGARDHDLLDLGARALRLVADHRHVDRHLPPAIDGETRVDDLGLDDRAALLLRAKVGARQEDHADRKAVRAYPVPRRRDRIVEEAHGQVDMDARPIPGLAVGIDRAAVPDCAQRLDRRLDDAARRLAVGRRDHADAAGIGFEVGAIHAFGFEPRVIGGGIVGHHLRPDGIG